MPGFKVVLGLANGKCVQKEVAENDAPQWFGKKLGDVVKGEMMGLAGYELKITGGSDASGFPMRWDVDGQARKKIFAVSGVGLKKTRKGMRVRKTVAGNTVSDKTAQLNMKVLKEGAEPLIPPEEPKAEEAKEEAKTEAPKAEEKAPEKKEAPQAENTEKKE